MKAAVTKAKREREKGPEKKLFCSCSLCSFQPPFYAFTHHTTCILLSLLLPPQEESWSVRRFPEDASDGQYPTRYNLLHSNACLNGNLERGRTEASVGSRSYVVGSGFETRMDTGQHGGGSRAHEEYFWQLL